MSLAFTLLCLLHLFATAISLEVSPAKDLTVTVLRLATAGQNGVARLGERVLVACEVSKGPAGDEVVMVRLRKLPLLSGGSHDDVQEVFAANMVNGLGVSRGRLRSPWENRPDVVFNSTSLSIAFNMTQADEGAFRCDAVTLDGERLGTYSVQLLTAQPATAPMLMFSGGLATDSSGATLEVVQGNSLTVNCTANVGKPAGDLQLTFVSSPGGNAGSPVAGVVNSSWTGTTGAPSQVVTTIFKRLVATLVIQEAHQNGSFVCRLVGGYRNGTGVGGNSTDLVATGPPVQALFEVRNIRMEPFRENFFHGDSLSCSAEGRPAPLVAWSKIQGVGDLPVNGSRLEMPVSAKPGYYSYTCSATNQIDGRSHQLLQSIGFNLRNRTAPAPTSGPSVSTRVQTWVASHQRGLAVALICLGSLAGLGLLGVVLVCACGCGGVGGYSRVLAAVGGGGAARERMRYYGELGESLRAGDYSSDEDEEGGDVGSGGGSRHLLGGKRDAAGGDPAKWNGTQV